MKKLVSIILAVVMVASVCCVTAFAENNDVQNEFLYQDKFEEFIGLPYSSDGVFVPYEYCYYDYEELCYHENEDSGEVDWVLVRALTNMEPNPWEVVEVKKVGNRYVKWLYPGISALPYGFAVYNATDDRFYDFYGVKPEEYEGLAEAFEELELGHAIGDVDMDKDITIMDVTEVQLYLAKEKEVPYGYYSYIPALADVDENGDMNILDATAIQLKLAGLDKPVVNEEMIMTVISSSSLEQSRPENAVKVPFETKYSAQQFLSPAYIDSAIPTKDTIVVIKSNEQYKSIFNDRAPEFTDEFFESQWLVATFIRTGCYEAVAPIGDISKCGDTLYVTANVYVPDDSGELQPLDPFWLSIAAVDRECLEDVYNVVKAK